MYNDTCITHARKTVLIHKPVIYNQNTQYMKPFAKPACTRTPDW